MVVKTAIAFFYGKMEENYSEAASSLIFVISCYPSNLILYSCCKYQKERLVTTTQIV